MRVFLVLVVFLDLRDVLVEKVFLVLKVCWVILGDNLFLNMFICFGVGKVFIVGFSDMVIFFFYL